MENEKTTKCLLLFTRTRFILTNVHNCYTYIYNLTVAYCLCWKEDTRKQINKCKLNEL